MSGPSRGPSRLFALIDQEPGRLSLRLSSRGGAIRLDVRPLLPAGAREIAATVDGARTAWRDSGVELVVEGSAQVVEVRWKGGLAVEPPLSALEPGQPDHGLRVLDFAAAADGWQLELEGPSGSSGLVRLHGEAPASADGATLHRAGAVTEAKVDFAPSTAAFPKAEVHLRR